MQCNELLLSLSLQSQHIRTTSNLIKYAENSSDDDHFDSGKRHHPRDESAFDDASDYDAHDDAAESDSDGDDDDDNHDDVDDDDEVSDIELTSNSTDRRNALNNNKDDGHTVKVRHRKIATLKQNKCPTRCSSGVRRAVDHNPDNLSRSSKMGCKDGESLFKYHCRCLSTYKEIYSNLLVHQKFVVPWSKDWPEEMWDLKLGQIVQHIRRGIRYSRYKEDLSALGFDFSNQVRGMGWVATKLALETYMSIHGNLQVPAKFKAPHNSLDWPEATWGLHLGISVSNIRCKSYYSEHRDELIRLGFNFNKSK